MTELLKVQGLSKVFGAPGIPLLRKAFHVSALRDVSFSLRKGEILGVVGESGCGKSTLARCIMRLVEPTAGSVEFDGHAFHAARPAELRALRPLMQMIFQDPYSSLNPRLTILQSLAEPLRVHRRMPGREARQAVEAMLQKVGLPAEAADKYPHAFSGGQRQRISIARALLLEPRLIIADEAVSALDVSIQAQILMLLRTLQAEHDLSFLFITHDLGVVRNFCDRVLVMYLGRIVEEGPVDTVLDAPRHPYTRSLVGAVPLPDPESRHHNQLLSGEIPSPADPPRGCAFHPRCDRASDICKQQVPMDTVSGDGRFACHFPIG